jgi:hypothetical protein
MGVERFEAKAFRSFNRLQALFKSERLNANIKLALHKALIKSVMASACPGWEFAAETRLLKMQCLQNKVLRTKAHIGLRCMWHCKFKVTLRNYAGNRTSLKNHENEYVGIIGQGEARCRK